MSNVTATTVFQIAPEGGEQWGDPVEVHISAGAGSYEDPGRFETETGLQGGYPNFFNIRHNGAEIFNFGSRLYSPDESILEDLIISAAIGDTITLDAAVWAHVFGTAEGEDGDFGFDSEVDFFADIGIEPSPVPVPASLWLLGSGIIGILGSGRIRLLRS